MRMLTWSLVAVAAVLSPVAGPALGAEKPSFDGRPVGLSELRGKVVPFGFFATT